jgi:tetratricopeptide (TPR) repeat protein
MTLRGLETGDIMRCSRPPGAAGPRTAALLAILVGLTIVVGAAGADDLRDGDKALKGGRLEEALTSYERATGRGKVVGQVGVGRVWLRRGRYDRAMDAFRRAAEMDPGLAPAHCGQGEVLRRQGKCGEAIPFFEQAGRLDRKSPEAQLGLGSCLVATGQIERGIAELNRGLKWSREWTPRFLVARGSANMARDSLRAAGIDFTQARELAPNDAGVRKAIGDFYVQRGTWALAIPEYEAALALDPSDIEVQYSLAQALFYDGRPELALQAYRKAVARDSDYAAGQLGLGNLLYLAGAADPRRYAEARAPLEKYTRLEPADPRGWSLLGRTCYHLGMRDSAVAAMVRAEQLGDQTREMFTALGRLYTERREWRKALEAFAKGEAGPRDLPLMGQGYEAVGEFDRADSIDRVILARDSTSATAAFAFSQRARLRYRARDFAGARPLFDRTIALDPDNGEAHFYRGLCLNELGQYPEALASLQRAAAIDSGKADRFFWLGVLSDRQKLRAGAERAFTRCTQLDSTGKLAGKAYRQLGFYRLLKKQWTAAIRLLERAVELDREDEQAWLWLAQAHQNAGNRDQASEGYRRVLGLNPGNAEAKKGLKSLGGSKPSRSM